MPRPARTLLARAVVPAAALAALLLAGPARAATVEEIPSPRPAGWSVDRTGRIPADTLRRLDRLGDEVKARSGAELAVVVIDSTGGEATRRFATRLFDRWGIGDRRRNNGILILAALDDHAVEIVLGTGIASEASRRVSAAIVQEEMVPRFRAGDPAGAVLAGALEGARRLLGVEPSGAADGEPAPAQEPPVPVGEAPLATPPAEASAAPAGAASAFLPTARAVGAATLIVLAGVGALFFAVRPRRCPRCGAPTLERRTWTVEQATDTHGGVVRVDERCASCAYCSSHTRSTPMLAQSGAASTWGSSSSSSSSSTSSGGLRLRRRIVLGRRRERQLVTRQAVRLRRPRAAG